MSTALPAYRALALQCACHAINAARDVADARARILANIDRIGAAIGASKAFIGPDLRLVVLPEYFATSYPLGETIPGWAEKAAFAIDGAEYARLSAIARQHAVFLSGNAYELDPVFPGLYFQASFVIDPAGTVVLRYRRLVSLFAPSPHDVWDAYLAAHGADAVFPVADTEIGRLACVASEEILYPEIARALALRGAEVLLHSTSEVGSPQLTPKDIAKRARAVENLCYVVSANSAGIHGLPFPAASTDGLSKIVDDQGRVLAEAGYGESMVANAEIDLAGLRRRRLRPGMGHTLSRLPQAAIALGLSPAPLAPNGFLADGQARVPERAEFAQRQRETIARMRASGVVADG
jgi:predicted amidohydrolase